MTDVVTHKPSPLIMIATVDEPLLTLTSATLAAEGYRTVIATDETKALAVCRRHLPDLIVLDLDLPGGDGYETCRRLRAEAGVGHVPVIILVDNPAVGEQALTAGATDVLPRRMEPELLGRRVNHLLDRAGAAQEVSGTQQVLERLQLLKEAIDSLPIGITITSTDGKIIYANPAEAEMHGLTLEELLSREARQFAPSRLHRELSTEDMHGLGVWRRESVNVRTDGEEFPVQLSSMAVRGGGGACLGIVTTCEDISPRKEAEQRIQRLAYYDPLTGLPNRRMFLDRLHQALALAQREKHRVGLLFLDLDNFKDTNDTKGHDFGDCLLREVAGRLGSCMRDSDTLARLGGDEFVVLLTSIASQESAAIAARRILAMFASPFDIGKSQVFSGASIGIALYPDDAVDAEGLLKCADTAMYQAKADGKLDYRFFSSELNERNLRRVTLENSMRQGLEREEFFLEYQPQWNVRTGRIVGVEALLRWQSRDFGLLQPSEFIPLAEKTGMISILGEWVLQTACRQGKFWEESGLAGLRIAVNISGLQLRQPDFLSLIDRTLAETGLPPLNLELEFTESILMTNAERAIAILKALKARGIQLSIDDFGTGSSTLSYLPQFPIDRIKIDRAFLKDFNGYGERGAIVTAILAMAKSLDIAVVAEGVETSEQLRFLTLHGCDELQGYFLARPMSADQVTGSLLGAEETVVTSLTGTDSLPVPS